MLLEAFQSTTGIVLLFYHHLIFNLTLPLKKTYFWAFSWW